MDDNNSNDKKIGSQVKDLKVKLNGDYRVGKKLSVFSTIYPTKPDQRELFERIKDMAMPLPEDDTANVEQLFERAVDASDPAWRSANASEFGVIVFYGPNAEEMARSVQKMGGKAAMIPGSEEASRSSLAPYQSSLTQTTSDIVLRRSNIKRQNISQKFKERAIQKLNSVLNEKTKELQTQYASSIANADIDTFPLYIMEAAFANKMENEIGGTNSDFHHDRIRKDTLLAETLERRQAVSIKGGQQPEVEQSYRE